MKKNRFIAKTRNVLAGVLALALAFGLVLALTGCDNGSNPAADTVVNAGLDLAGKVTAPVKDAAPVTTAINTAQFTGTVAWQTAAGAAVSGTFAASTVYKAVITLTAKSGFTFDGFAGTFTYAGAAVSYAAGVVTITFPATAAAGADTAVNADLDLTDKVTAPVKGAAPVTTAINETQFTGAVAWQTEAGAAVSGTFAVSTVYKAVITLTAKSGFTFDGFAGTFTYAGATVSAYAEGVVTITFPVTAAAELTWTAVTDTTFVSTYITDIAYGGGTFVAVGYSGKAAYSTDGGVTWKADTNTVTVFKHSYYDISNSINDIAYGGPAGQERFVAVGGATVAYSADGVTWTKSSMPGFADGYITYIGVISYGGPAGQGKFIAIGDGKAAYSTSGVSWTAVTDTAFGGYIIAYGGGKFVTVGSSKAAWSPDGVSWTAVTDTNAFTTFTDEYGNTSICGIAYGGGRFVAVGYGGRAAYSPDGETWTLVTDTTFGSTDIYGIAYGGGKFVAVGEDGKAAYSTDGGVTWTKVTNTNFPTEIVDPASGKLVGYFIDGITYGGPAGQEKFVAFGGYGGYASSDKAAWSTDGVSWTAVTDTTFGANSILDIAYGGGRFVAVGANGKAAYSNKQE